MIVSVEIEIFVGVSPQKMDFTFSLKQLHATLASGAATFSGTLATVGGRTLDVPTAKFATTNAACLKLVVQILRSIDLL